MCAIVCSVAVGRGDLLKCATAEGGGTILRSSSNKKTSV